MFDGAAFGKEVVASVKEYLERTLEPVFRRIELLEALPQPENGKDADPELVARTVTETVERVLGGWERPANGIDGKDGRDGPEGEAGAPGRAGAPGEDGIGVANAFQDKDGNLILTLSDGRTANVGRVQGGDGRDGAGFDDMTEELDDDGRTVIRRYRRGDEVKEFRHTFAVILDRGVYRAEEAYAKGDAVSFGGSLWIAQEPTHDKPEASSAWRLAVKRGRDGKDGIVRAIPDKPIVKVVK